MMAAFAGRPAVIGQKTVNVSLRRLFTRCQLDNTRVEQFIEDALWWMKCGIDGARVDAVKHVDDLAIFNLVHRVNERLRQQVQVGIWMARRQWAAGDRLEDNAEQYGTIVVIWVSMDLMVN